MCDPSFNCLHTDCFSAKADTEDRDGLFNPTNSSMFSTLLSFPDTDPLYVSPSNQEPSEKTACCLSILFPNVPERAKQNNILLTKKEIYCLNYYISEFDSYCTDYDVTIVVDGGGSMEEEIQRIVVEHGLKKNCVKQVGESCVILMTNSTHEYGSTQLYNLATRSKEFEYWESIVDSWGKTITNFKKGSIVEFHESFPEWGPSQLPEDSEENDFRKKRPDAGAAPCSTNLICKAFDMTPIPTLTIEVANSDDFRKLFHDCITWIAGALLQINAAIGVNNAPDTYSVDILNFDLTIERMMELVRTLQGEQYVHTRVALCQVVKMKSSVQILHLTLLDYLLSNPELCKGKVTQKDIDSINRYIQEEIAQAQALCPNLGIRPLELSRFPAALSLRWLQPFLNDIKTELKYYKTKMAALEGIETHLCPEEAIAQCAHILAFHTMPLSFGPILPDCRLPQKVTLQIPIRAFAGMGNGHIEIPPDKLENYLSRFFQGKKLEDQTCKHNPIPLEWINDPTSLAADRNISVEEMSPEKYDSRKTLGGEIKFCYLTDKALQHILNTESGFNIGGNTNSEYAIWTVTQNKARNATKKPLLKHMEAQNNIQRELGYTSRRIECGRVPHRLMPSSYHRKGPIYPVSRGVHTTAFPLPGRGFYPKWYPTRVCGTLWTTLSRLPRH